MNDIYEHKAEKYKYKYLKLKQELYGGENNFQGCIKSPPVNFNEDIIKKLNIEQVYPNKTSDKYNINNIISETNTSAFFGRLMNYKDYKNKKKIEVNKIEVNKNKIENIPNIDLKYINSYYYVFKIKNYKYIPTLKTSETYNILNQYEFFNTCKKSKISKNYAYIIGNANNYNEILPPNAEQKKKTIYKSLDKINDVINKFIKPLHNASYILNNIPENSENNSSPIYVDISEMTEMTDNNKNNDIEHLIKLISYLVERYFENKGDLAYISIQNNKDKINIDNLSEIITTISTYLKTYSKSHEWKYSDWEN
jgi:hypothetical protein